MLQKTLLPAFLLLSTTAHADTLKVATDIAPVQSLVAMILGDTGTAEALIEPGTSPHNFSLKPSQARAMSEADFVVWIGPGLIPQLEESFETMAAETPQLVLMDVPGILTLEYRDAEEIGHDDHGHDDHGDEHAKHDDHGPDDNGDEHAKHDDHGHDDHGDEHDDHAHEDDHAHDDHDDHKDDHAEHKDHGDHGDEHAEHEDHAGHDDHGHHHGDGPDPHLWLAPENAVAWLPVIAEELAKLNPEQAETYRANAAAGQTAIETAIAEAKAILAPVEGLKIAVYHDAFQYYENAFGLDVMGALADGEATPSGPAQLKALQAEFEAQAPACLLAEPTANTKLATSIAPDLPIVDVDQLGSGLEIGATLYPALLVDIAKSVSSCAK